MQKHSTYTGTEIVNIIHLLDKEGLDVLRWLLLEECGFYSPITHEKIRQQIKFREEELKIKK